jgi:hypothetical protein
VNAESLLTKEEPCGRRRNVTPTACFEFATKMKPQRKVDLSFHEEWNRNNRIEEIWAYGMEFAQ